MNAPTLIIGLGGKGSDVALRVSKLLNAEQRRQIGFAVFDTDVNELRKIKEENPFVHTIQTSTKLSVGEYLDIDTHARDTWFPVNAILNSKTLTEGAGQVRAISRMAFETAVRAGKLEELHKAIEELYKVSGEEYQQALRIIIVSSLAGGTGSGLILPVALYVKNYLATRFRQSANISRGFFLLPEVFYGVIPGQAERNNLKSNAYATLRELDAFLMKGDSTLPEKYANTVKMEFPCVGSGEYEEYAVRPFDFCFLYDAQNADGNKLNSFDEYLEHAANCIYAMSIGPMNKRSNSSEDNTIRKLCAENGRNRYAGAGTSRLVYPVEDVKKYLALNWTKEAVSKQWMQFDEMLRAQREKNQKDKKKGIRVAEIKEDKAYMDAVEQKKNDKDPFAMAIYEACGRYDEGGFERESDNWDEYIAALKQKIKDENSAGQGDLDMERSKTEAVLNEITPGSDEAAWGQYVDAYKALVRYKGMIKKYVDSTARTIAFSIFDPDADEAGASKLNFRLEKYMRNSKGDFIHPNAVRYFLYKVKAGLEGELLLTKANVISEEKFFDEFVEHNFDNPETDAVETANVHDLSKTKKVSLTDKIFKKISADQEELISQYSEYLRRADAYRVDAIYEAVLEEGLDYVKRLCQSFQNFYRSFGSKIDAISQEIAILENKHVQTSGSTARYVCASPKCMKKMLLKMPYTGGEIDIDSELAERIYSRVKDFAMLDSRPEKTNYFSSIFDVDILNYFEEALLKAYASDIDMDIITAIEREAQYQNDNFEYDAELLEQYVVKTFHQAKTLAAPFIEKPLGEEKDPIPSCTYNKQLNPKDDSPRARMIDRELKSFGGEPDEDVPMNEILFYKSFYGLRANDLSKFAPPQKAATYNRPGGEYFKAYYELVGKIHPVSNRSRVITPHIDRWWHNVAMMPDLDEQNQAEQEHNIYAALFWGLVNGYIDRYKDNEKSIYKLQNADDIGVDEDSSTLVVSNGTECDKLYEIWDALSIYPQLVSNILERSEKELQIELNGNKTIWTSGLLEALETFRIREFELGDKETRSIFDLPLLMKRSMTSDIYDEKKVIGILKAEIAEIEKYIARFCAEKEFAEVTGKIICSQFERFLRDIEAESEEWKDIYHDYIFTNTCSCIAKALEDIGLSDKGKEIRKQMKELSK